ncbi:MAG: hypothetical protein HOV68_05475 [Streptomycetaceae bacterium]|nr:hypothetical protein [Streptomycetaceae bacterium]
MPTRTPRRTRKAGPGQLDALASGPRPTLWHWGLGADSTAGLDLLLDDPAAFGFRDGLGSFAVVVAHTGDEWTDTYELAERFLLPRLREHRIRTIEISRAGPEAKDGIVVLSDTDRPNSLHRRGPWTLTDELNASGTVPLRGVGLRSCSDKFKGWVLDLWAKQEFGPLPYRVAVGFNADEVKRARRDVANTVATRRPWFPLIARRLARVDVELHLLQTYGVKWPKSYCTVCPFPSKTAAREDHIDRMRRYPQQGADSLLVEHIARALNPRMTLRTSGSLLEEVLAAKDTDAVVARYEQLLRERPTALYEIRRILPAARSNDCDHEDACTRPECRDPNKRGRALRSLRTVTAGTPGHALARLRDLATEHKQTVEVDEAGFHRVTLAARADTYPTVEHLYAVGPTGPVDKELEAFAGKWATATGDPAGAG